MAAIVTEIEFDAGLKEQFTDVDAIAKRQPTEPASKVSSANGRGTTGQGESSMLVGGVLQML
jgi:hypothetical protein